MIEPTVPRVLLVEDDPAITHAVRSLLASEDISVIAVDDVESALSHLELGTFDLVLTDLRLPGMGGLELLDRVRSGNPRLPVIMMTAHGSTEVAIEATKRGAYDYVVKPFDPDELLELVLGAVERSRLLTETVVFGDDLPPDGGLALIGRSRAMQTLCKEIGRIAGTTLPVLILGETGTGKELVARALFQHGSRATGPFLAVNCAAVPETLIESELFGHERGAFTGAERRRIGRFEQAHEGTLFLDEIGDLALAAQAKLLRILQDGCFQRIGGEEVLQTDVRLVSATHRDLEREVFECRGFREDLFFRIGGSILRIPPLRERRDDIPLLTMHFLRRHGPAVGVLEPIISTEALAWLTEQPWPGNVRQLENVARQALLKARPRPIGLDHVRRVLNPRPSTETPAALSHAAYVARLIEGARSGELTHLRDRMIAELEGELFRQALQAADGNQAQVARWLGTSRRTLREVLRNLGDPSSHRTSEPVLKGPKAGAVTPPNTTNDVD